MSASQRLADSPACLVASKSGPDLEIERLLSRQNRGVGAKPILELNMKHALVKALGARQKASHDSDVSDLSALLFEQAQILDGEVPDDPAAFAARLNRLVVGGSTPDPISAHSRASGNPVLGPGSALPRGRAAEMSGRARRGLRRLDCVAVDDNGLAQSRAHQRALHGGPRAAEIDLRSVNVAACARSRAAPWPPVLSISGTAEKSRMNTLGCSPTRSRTVLTAAVAPKKNAPEMRKTMTSPLSALRHRSAPAAVSSATSSVDERSAFDLDGLRHAVQEQEGAEHDADRDAGRQVDENRQQESRQQHERVAARGRAAAPTNSSFSAMFQATTASTAPSAASGM